MSEKRRWLQRRERGEAADFAAMYRETAHALKVHAEELMARAEVCLILAETYDQQEKGIYQDPEMTRLLQRCSEAAMDWEKAMNRTTLPESSLSRPAVSRGRRPSYVITKIGHLVDRWKKNPDEFSK